MVDEIETVGKSEPVVLPIYALRGAIACTADDKTPDKSNTGVFIHRVEDTIRVVAKDGHRLFVASLEQGKDAKIPGWLDDGVLIPAADLKPRLGLIEKLENTTAIVSFTQNAAHVTVSDQIEACVFKMRPIPAQFSNYQLVVERMSGAFSREVETDWKPVGYSAAYLKEVGAMAKVLGSEFVRVYSSTEYEPSVFCFDEAPGVVLYLMPSKISSALDPQTARLLAGPIQGTIRALTAHQTRWEMKLDPKHREANGMIAEPSEFERSEIEAKIDHFKKRIANVIANANPPALPAPEPAGQDKGPQLEMEPSASVSVEAEGEETGETGEQSLIEPSDESHAERIALKPKLAKRAAAEFARNCETALAEVGLSEIATREQLDAWFFAGHSLENVLALVMRQAQAEGTPAGESGEAAGETGTEGATAPVVTGETEQGPAEPDDPSPGEVRSRRKRARTVLSRELEPVE